MRLYFLIFNFVSFFFLFRTLEDFLRMPNLIIVQSPLIFNIDWVWVGSYISINNNITQNAANSRLEILAVARGWYTNNLQTLLFCSWLWEPFSIEVTHINNSLLTVLVAPEITQPGPSSHKIVNSGSCIINARIKCINKIATFIFLV